MKKPEARLESGFFGQQDLDEHLSGAIGYTGPVFRILTWLHESQREKITISAGKIQN